MHLKKYMFVLSSVFAIVVLGAANMPFQQDEKAKNLKVLNKDVSHEALHAIMDQYNDALGVKCNYCHAPSKTDLSKLDFASDEKPAKDIARNMMRMTAQINEQFFNVKGKNGEVSESVSCITCHNGQEYPAFKKQVLQPRF